MLIQIYSVAFNFDRILLQELQQMLLPKANVKTLIIFQNINSTHSKWDVPSGRFITPETRNNWL